MIDMRPLLTGKRKKMNLRAKKLLTLLTLLTVDVWTLRGAVHRQQQPHTTAKTGRKRKESGMTARELMALTEAELRADEQAGIATGALCRRCAATRHRGRCQAENVRLFHEARKR